MPAPHPRGPSLRTLRSRVRILTPTVVDDGAGGRVITWPTTGPTRWARVMQLGSGEAVMAAALPRGRDTYRILMRRDVAPSSTSVRVQPIDPAGPPLEIIGIRAIEDRDLVEIDAIVAEDG